MASTRMTAEERRVGIIKAAIPLFAEKGFNGASVRDIASAAGISEALIYRHFPSKEALYEDLLSYTRNMLAASTPEFEVLEPGAETLITLVYFTIEVIMLDVPGRGADQRAHERLLFQSLIGDTAFAQGHFNALEHAWSDRLSACIDVATKKGDIIAMPVPPANRIWFTHHLAMALNLCHVSGEPAFDYEGTREELAEQAIMFCLRGIGLTEKAIRRNYDRTRLQAFKEHIFG
jgi:AcrR family transcriptional regulator